MIKFRNKRRWLISFLHRFDSRRKKSLWQKYSHYLPLVLLGILVGWYISNLNDSSSVPILPIPEYLSPTPLPTPTPKPVTLSFAQLEVQFGPCVQVPTLMYHHIQTEAEANSKGQKSLSVFTPMFQEQMLYLKDKGYTPITMSQLIDFFDTGVGLPQKPVLLTFDDAYDDVFTDAYPILKDLGFHATVFVPTGLIDNPEYMTWNQLTEMSGSNLILMANHTWSHHSMKTDPQTDTREISTADQQLNEKGMNKPKVFAYPYGGINVSAQKDLTDLNYQLAFTTVYGKTLCKGQRYMLPRVRVGNGPLINYGL